MLRPALLALLLAAPAAAEEAVYGSVDLTGLGREMSWPLNRPGPTNAMVCNVNGPDGFLTVRAEPAAGAKPVRHFERLAVLVVDTAQRQGHWIRVLHAYRNTDKAGAPIPSKEFTVAGWVHDGYLCDFLD